MKTTLKNIMTNALLGVALSGIAQGTTGCSIDVGEGGGYYLDDSYSYGGSSDSYDPTEDKLVVSGSGETIQIQYNTLSFSARLNWTDGNFYFAPDPDGAVSGNKIICRAEITSSDVTGDCFRTGQVCHFRYYNYWSDSDEGEIYAVSENSCKTAGAVGPFLVPLDSPTCGEDPYPACPSEDLFPSGQNEAADGVEDEGENEGDAIEDDVESARPVDAVDADEGGVQ